MRNLEEIREFYGTQLALGAFELGAIKLNLKDPFTWTSGYRMPIYNDNRKLLCEAKYRKLIASAFSEIIETLGVKFDNIAGTATAGIPHATSLADKLDLPLSYIRSSNKEYGMGHKIEGLGKAKDYEGKNILLIEDLISTGKSSLQAVDAIRSANGIVDYCLAIFTYGMNEATVAFENAKCTPLTILTYEHMIKIAIETKYISEEEGLSLQDWRLSTTTWGEKNGFPKVVK